MKYYTIEEAFTKKLLFNGDKVDLRYLYTPLKYIPLHYPYNSQRLCDLCIRSLASYFPKICFLSKDDATKERPTGKIYRNNETFQILIEWILDVDKLKQEDTYATSFISDFKKEIAEKLLSVEDYEIRATAKDDLFSYTSVTIEIPGSLQISFEEDEVIPYLYYPEHNAYSVS